MDRRPVEGFADIDIAKTGDDALIEQQQFDRGAASCEATFQLPWRYVERLRTQRLERRPLGEIIGRYEIDRAEPARIVEGQAISFVGLQQQMVVLLEPGVIDPPASRHAEMKDHRVISIGMNEPIFRAPSKPGDGSPG